MTETNRDMASSGWRRRLAYVLGLLCFALGAIGAFLPLLPTVPFWILAALLLANASPRWRDRIYNDPHFGLSVRNFIEYRVVSRRAKRLAWGGMTLGWLISAWLGLSPLLLAVVAAMLLLVARYLHGLPEQLAPAEASAGD